MPTIRTILHPVSLSPADRAASRVAGSLARAHGARLVVLHVMWPWYVHGRGEMLGAFLRQRRERWDALTEPRPEYRGLALEYRLAQGEPVPAILRAAADVSCDLIVVGRRGRSGLVRRLRGGTADRIVRSAPCPVLTVRDSLPGWASAAGSGPVVCPGAEVRIKDHAPGRAPARRRTPADHATGGVRDDRFPLPLSVGARTRYRGAGQPG